MYSGVKNMDLLIDNHIMNPRQLRAAMETPELVESVNIEPHTGKVYMNHSFFMTGFHIGTLPTSILPILTKLKFSVKSWKIVDDAIFINITIDNNAEPEITKGN